MKNNFLKQTYSLLAIAVLFSCLAACIVIQIPPLVAFLASPIGWLLSILAINLYPILAVKLADNPDDGIFAKIVMAIKGTIGGIVLSPLLFMVSYFSKGMFTGNQLIFCALGLTATVFSGITYYVFNREYRYDFDLSQGLMTGAALSLFLAIPLNAFVLHSGFFGWIILVIMGFLGTFQLVSATADIAEDTSQKNPVVSAIMLYAGLFNLFQVILVTIVNLVKESE